jgi:hypothetical protein
MPCQATTLSDMRVLHIINYLGRGGGCVSPLQFADAANLAGIGHHEFLTIGSVQYDEVHIPDSIVVHQNRGRSLALCKRWIVAQSYDILHWHWWEPIPLISSLANYTDAARLVTVDVYPASPDHRLRTDEIAYTDMLVFDGRDAMHAYGDIPGEMKRWVLGATELPSSPPIRTRREDGKLRFGRGSALNRWKCSPNLIDDVAPLFSAVREAEFYIYGEGPLKRHLTARVKHLDLEDRIVFAGWVDDFQSELANLDVYLYHLPVDSYGSSELNLQLAAAVGLPIVVQPSSGIRWMFDDRQDALVASDPGTATSVAIALARDPALRAILGRNAREKATTEWGMPTMLDGYRAIYSELMEGRSRSHRPRELTRGFSRHGGRKLLYSSWLPVPSLAYWVSFVRRAWRYVRDWFA